MSKQIKMISRDGVTLHTAGKYVPEDIHVVPDEKILGTPEVEYPNETIKYYKENRNKNYPYFPLPSEMEETQDTIYMLYDANGYMCCPVIYVTFTECVCTIQKYMNTTLVSEYVESIASGSVNYLQFSEEDEDYLTYNYIVIKLQGSITKHWLNYASKFNGYSYDINSSSELIEVSGKCVGCNIRLVGGAYNKYYQNLEYYSFLGVTSTDMSNHFANCFKLKAITMLDTSNALNMNAIFKACYSLQTIPQIDTSKVKDMSSAFNEMVNLQTIPLLDFSNVTSANNTFNNCFSLKVIPSLNFSNVTSANSNTFGYTPLLNKLDIINMKVSFSLSYSKMLTQSELVKILNNLATVETTQTLTLGSTLLAKLTDEQKAIATAKGWTLA